MEPIALNSKNLTTVQGTVKPALPSVLPRFLISSTQLKPAIPRQQYLVLNVPVVVAVVVFAVLCSVVKVNVQSEIPLQLAKGHFIFYLGSIKAPYCRIYLGRKACNFIYSTIKHWYNYQSGGSNPSVDTKLFLMDFISQ